MGGGSLARILEPLVVRLMDTVRRLLLRRGQMQGVPERWVPERARRSLCTRRDVRRMLFAVVMTVRRRSIVRRANRRGWCPWSAIAGGLVVLDQMARTTGTPMARKGCEGLVDGGHSVEKRLVSCCGQGGQSGKKPYLVAWRVRTTTSTSMRSHLNPDTLLCIPQHADGSTTFSYHALAPRSRVLSDCILDRRLRFLLHRPRPGDRYSH
jgi:hypothetical protein